jgi:hypothetical protein
MPTPNQQLVFGSRRRDVVLIDLVNALTAADQNGITAGFWFDSDGNIYRQSTVSGGTSKTPEMQWLLSGQATEYQFRVTTLSGMLTVPQPIDWRTVTAAMTGFSAPLMAVQLNANTTGSAEAEVKLELRKIGEQQVLASGIWLLKAERDPNALNYLHTHTIRGVGTGSGSQAATASLILDPLTGTASATYTNVAPTTQTVAIETFDYNNIRPDGVMVTANKTEGGGDMFASNAGLNRILPLSGKPLVWQTREPDRGQQKTVVMNLTFYKGSTVLYSSRITLQADCRVGAANAGVT